MSGIFGFSGRGNAFNEVRYGLENLSHRGQESWGITAGLKDGSFSEARKTGSIFLSPPPARPYFGSIAIGHVRYPTAGEASIRNSQPIIGSFGKDKISIAHNGHIPKYKALMERIGGLCQTDTDTEVILHMIAKAEGGDIVDKIRGVLTSLSLNAAFSLIIAFQGKLIAARDPFGFRPLSLARRGEEGYHEWAFASETCAFSTRFGFIKEIEPGEIYVLDGDEAYSITYAQKNPHFCLLECLDFASPASMIFSENVYSFREKTGEMLAEEEDAEGDTVIPIPRAAVPAALGFHNKLGIPYREAINTVGEIGRIFIVSKEKDRLEKAEKKFQINRELIKDKEVFLIDTVLVRGSTAMILIPKLREAGAKKIHMRLTSPPPKYPCFMGMAMAKPGELLSTGRTDEDLRRLLKVDTFRYLSIDKLKSISPHNYCDACFTGIYPFNIH
ncbi:MAG: amidophosphoribosyltransferase [Syntrophorhabdaceae bacterium]|nr:amidophosphoribosyltransferase [Syntrophorhabdaceae bacterium]